GGRVVRCGARRLAVEEVRADRVVAEFREPPHHLLRRPVIAGQVMDDDDASAPLRAVRPGEGGLDVVTAGAGDPDCPRAQCVTHDRDRSTRCGRDIEFPIVRTLRRARWPLIALVALLAALAIGYAVRASDAGGTSRPTVGRTAATHDDDETSDR